MSFRRVFALTVLIAAGVAQAQTPAAAPADAPKATPAPAATTAAPTPAAEPAKTETAAGPTGLILGDATAGQAKAAACGACHGIDGNPSDKSYPKLAGQNEAYIVRQLENFKSGKRVNPIMVGFAAPLSEQDMHDIGAYFASKTSLPGVADDKLLAAGQALYRGGDAKLGVPACMACHGPDGHGMAGAGYPQLAGQWTDYVANTLKAWKGGTTWGDDEHARIMPTIAGRLTEADIAALSSYVEGLHTTGAGDQTAAAK